MALDDRETPQTGEVSEVNPREDRSIMGGRSGLGFLACELLVRFTSK